jgi:two-component system sensor histidine kinase HydH
MNRFNSVAPLEAAASGPSDPRESEREFRLHQLAKLGELAGGLAHELKNPLSTIKLNLQLLQEDIADVPNLDTSRARVQTLRREVDRLHQTLDSFLKFAGRIELNRQVVRVNAIIRDMIDFFTPQAAASQVRMHASLADDDLPLSLDVNLFKQALLNMMLNAVQAMPSGGDLIIRTAVHNGTLVLDVSDTGVGIPPEQLSRLFEAFHTTKKGGTGLGLATTRRIIEEHGGHISVESQPGRGTNFRLELPLNNKNPLPSATGQ